MRWARIVRESWCEQQDRAFGIRVNGFIAVTFVTLALAAVWRHQRPAIRPVQGRP